MILVVNVGNTNITCGVFDTEKLVFQIRIRSNINYTEDQYFAVLFAYLQKHGIKEKDIRGGIVGSVVPAVTHIFVHMFKKYFGIKPVLLSDAKLNIKNKYQRPHEVGDDRLANAVAGRKLFGKQDMVIIDFGTAISFDVLNKKGEYLGGAIMPGLNLSLQALFQKTAKLPQVALDFPKNYIGATTEQSVQSGILYGVVGAIDKILKGIKKELGVKKIKIILTGGDAGKEVAVRMADKDVFIDNNFTLKGFKLIYDLNSKKKA